METHNKTLVIFFAGVLLSFALQGVYSLFLNYDNYDECILDKMPGVSDRYAALSIRDACENLTE